MRAVSTLLACGALILESAWAKVYFEDTFETDPFADGRWVASNWKQDTGEAGKWEFSGGLWGADGRGGLRTSEDARFYAITSKLDTEFDNTDKTLVFSLSVKHEQKIDCGGGYAKLLPSSIDVKNFNGESPYTVMFGPDICGYSTKKVHTIFDHNQKNLLKKSDVKCEDDEYTYFYTLIVRPDETYEIRINNEIKDSGNLKDGWDFENPKTIKDPDAKKPADWVDNKFMDDPEDVKPADWDDEPEKIADPEATKPDDWDDEEDGEWEAPLIDNPNYKGVWKPKQIENPLYKGPWVHPEIPNPDYVEEKDVYKRTPIGYIGIEVWQVKAGTVFSDFFLSDSVEEFEQFYNRRKKDLDAEKEAKKAYDELNKPNLPEEDEMPDFEDMDFDMGEHQEL